MRIGCFAATILLYPAPLAWMLGEMILMLVIGSLHLFGDMLFRSNYSIISGPHWPEC